MRTPTPPIYSRKSVGDVRQDQWNSLRGIYESEEEEFRKLMY